jgi:HK97 gp10 family phage protein
MADFDYEPGGIEHLARDRNGDIARALLSLAIQVETAAKRRCPVDTGRLRSSISHELRVDSTGLHAVIGTNVIYAPYVEYGTWRSPAQPYLRPALYSIVGITRV